MEEEGRVFHQISDIGGSEQFFTADMGLIQKVSGMNQDRQLRIIFIAPMKVDREIGKVDGYSEQIDYPLGTEITLDPWFPI